MRHVLVLALVTVVVGCSKKADEPRAQSGPAATPSTGASAVEPKPGSRPTVEIGEPIVPASLDAGAVRDALRRRVGYARMCYSAALADAPGLQGKVVLRLTLDAKGDVEEVGVPESTVKNYAFQDCLERGGQGLHFPAPAKALAKIDVPLTFSLE